MTLPTSTLRPGFLVSLKMSTRGNVQYIRQDLNDELPEAAEDKPAVKTSVWKTTRTIEDAAEHDAAQKARAKAGAIIRGVCKQSAFGLLCPDVDADKLEKAVADARAVVDAFNESAKLSRVGLYILTGRVMPDDVEAVRAISSEIRELMGEMSGGIENGNVDAIRQAASRVKGIGEMLAAESRAKVQMAVETARAAAKQIVKDREQAGAEGVVAVDKGALKRLAELRGAFLDIDEEAADVAAPKAKAAPKLDLTAE